MTGEPLPKARIRRRRLFRMVWVVPIIALGFAAFLVIQHMRSMGPQIAIRFADASGLRPGQTPVVYRGVQIGEVTGIELSETGARRWLRRGCESRRRRSRPRAPRSGSCGRSSVWGT